MAAQAELNGAISHFGLAAVMVLLFSVWDWFVDPAGWRKALVIRIAAVEPLPSPGFRVTVSRGAAAVLRDQRAPNEETFEQVLKAADDAPYRAKAAGRNRVVGATSAAALK